MNIQPTSTNNISMNGINGKKHWYDCKLMRVVRQKTLDLFPEKTLKENAKLTERYKKYGEIMARPAENRLIVGATAIVTQPVIDYYNHRVDEETRTVSRNRTIAKIIAGTSVGVIVRELCYQLINHTTNVGGKHFFSKWLLPNKVDELLKHAYKLKNYKNTISTLVALGVMAITNVVIDAPLTIYLTNKFNAKCNIENEPMDKKENSLKEGGLYG